MGEMKRAITREEQDRRTQDRFASTIVIAASIIAAVRYQETRCPARDETHAANVATRSG